MYQIKHFYQALTPSQRGQIEKSFQRFLLGFVRGGWPIADWYLMMPLDPTTERDSDWFDNMPGAVIQKMFNDDELALTESEKEQITAWRTAPGRKTKWEGLTACDNLAAKYPHVADYFVHGGRERLKDAVATLGAILQRDVTLPDPSQQGSVALLTPAEVEEHLQRLQRVLDTDPHYRYAWGFSPTPPEIGEEEDLVAATQQIHPDGSALTFKIYQRFPEALNERPIPIKLKFAVGDAAFDQQAFETWRKYGKPLTAPAEVEADLPGGLGEAMSGELAQVTIRPVGQTYLARFRIRKPDGTFGVILSFSMTVSAGSDGTGTWERGTDDTGFLTMEITSALETHTGTWDFTRSGIVGSEVVAALPSVEFVQDLHAPNVLQVAQKYGPFSDYAAIPPHEPKFPDAVIDYLRALAIIQTRTPTPVLIPDLTTVPVKDVQAVIEVAALIDGQTVISAGWESARFKSDAAPKIGPGGLPERQVDLANHYQIRIIEPLSVRVGSQQLTLGAVERLLLSVKYEDEGGTLVARPFLNDTAYRTFSPDAPVPDNNNRPVAARVLGTLSEAIERVDD